MIKYIVTRTKYLTTSNIGIPYSGSAPVLVTAPVLVPVLDTAPVLVPVLDTAPVLVYIYVPAPICNSKKKSSQLLL